jgi:tetratricopeptide (TPR) repeat protein
MRVMQFRSRGVRRAMAAWMIFFLSVVTSCPGLSGEEGDQEGIYREFEEVSFLRSQGRYEQAIEILREMIQEYSKSDEILRRAYADLVFTLTSKGDTSEAVASAREALDRYPDLTADPVYFPSSINVMFNRLRGEMFGSLRVTTRPDSCRLYLNHDFIGFSPLEIAYVNVGEYVLNARMAGYHEQSTTATVEPGSPTSIQLSLDRQRDRKWYLWRIGPAALATSIILVLQLQGDKGESQPSPLPEPPPPPGD